MKTHPPLPPGCKMLQSVNGDIRLLLSYEGVVPITKLANTRAIIAALARCAWLDEAERQQGIATGGGQYIRPEPRALSAACHAVNNAEAWKEWGEEK